MTRRGAGRARTPPAGESDRRTEVRGDYRGPDRFRHATSYEVRREWDRLEGTPQRDLLREIRERFLQRALGGTGATPTWGVEIGPGPGRFTPLLLASVQRALLVDLSSAMLHAAREHLERASWPGGAGGTGRTSLVRADAARMPLRPRSAGAVVALGNVVGFAQAHGAEVLAAIAAPVAPGGLLVVEVVGPTHPPSPWQQVWDLPRWRRALTEDPARALAQWQRDLRARPPRTDPSLHPRPSGPGGPFVGMGTEEVVRELTRAGLETVDRAIAAPLFGGDPRGTAALLGKERRRLLALLRLEEGVGRHPAVLRAGGHLLLCARRR